VLEEEGFNVNGVTNAKDALETLREAPVSCIIADHKLRGETGIELAQSIKRIKRNVPVILYSGSIPGSLQNIDAYVSKGRTDSHVCEGRARDPQKILRIRFLSSRSRKAARNAPSWSCRTATPSNWNRIRVENCISILCDRTNAPLDAASWAN